MPPVELHPQVLQRANRRAKDQHGRIWETLIHTPTNSPVAAIRPKFSAPWIPDSQYVKWRHNEDVGAYVEIDYGAIKQSRKVALVDWTSELMKMGFELQGEAFNPDRPSAGLLNRVGPRPKPVEPVIAAEFGDPWVLGLVDRDQIPPWAIPFFTTEKFDESAFMREAEERVARLMEAERFAQEEEENDPDAVGGKTVRNLKAEVAATRIRENGRFVKTSV